MKFSNSGERRFRVSQMAGLTEIPAYIRLADDRQLARNRRNLQREDLDPIEMAYSRKRMMDELGQARNKLHSALERDDQPLPTS